MTTKPKTKARGKKTEPKTKQHGADDPEQYERFREFASEHETDQSGDSFERSFKAIVRSSRRRSASR
jgi:hypothetical protein